MPSRPGAGEPPEVSIVIVSWNVAPLLAMCLRSIREHAGDLRCEVIVTDNHSSDGTADMVRRDFPAVRLIVNGENAGFARANNVALAHARGQYIFFLNPDTLLTGGALQGLVRFLKEHADAGIVGPRVCGPEGDVQKGCARLSFSLAAAFWCEALHLHEMPGVNRWFFRRYVSPYDYGVTQEVAAVSGAAMLVPAHLAKEAGGFGESYLHGGEDLDFCFRLRRKGWKTYLLAEATILHLGGASAKQAPVRSAVNVALSNHQFFLRCHGRWQAGIYRIICQGVGVPVMLLIGITKLTIGAETGSAFRTRMAVATRILAWEEVR